MASLVSVREGMMVEMLERMRAGAQNRRIAVLSTMIGREIGLGESDLRELAISASAHDVGNLGVPGQILFKPGPLTATERSTMELHTLIGAELLSAAGRHPDARLAALTHHERWDGKGYPRGLAGEDIPLFGRIIAIADVFCALASDRPYKSAYSLDTSMRIIRRGRGRNFDPALVDAFLRSMPAVAVLQ